MSSCCCCWVFVLFRTIHFEFLRQLNVLLKYSMSIVGRMYVLSIEHSIAWEAKRLHWMFYTCYIHDGSLRGIKTKSRIHSHIHVGIKMNIAEITTSKTRQLITNCFLYRYSRKWNIPLRIIIKTLNVKIDVFAGFLHGRYENLNGLNSQFIRS